MVVHGEPDTTADVGDVVGRGDGEYTRDKFARTGTVSLVAAATYAGVAVRML